MSVFSRATFSAAGYAAFRPTYPPALFRAILAYHQPVSPPGTLLDLGCGHGLVARELAPHFARAVGVDPSPGMVAQAASMTPAGADIAFRQGGAEDLSFLAAGEADLAAAAQAAHWFDFARAWPQLARAVRPGGTLAFWGYKDPVLVGRPRANAVFDAFVYGEAEVAPGTESLRRFWEQPGRDVLRRLLADVVPPPADWADVERVEYDPDRELARVAPADEEKAWLRRRMRLGELEGYVRTYSSFRAWQDAHPERKSRADGGEGDVLDLMFDKMVEAVDDWRAMGERWREAEVDAVWGTVILLARRRL